MAMNIEFQYYSLECGLFPSKQKYNPAEYFQVVISPLKIKANSIIYIGTYEPKTNNFLLVELFLGAGHTEVSSSI